MAETIDKLFWAIARKYGENGEIPLKLLKIFLDYTFLTPGERSEQGAYQTFTGSKWCRGEVVPSHSAAKCGCNSLLLGLGTPFSQG